VVNVVVALSHVPCDCMQELRDVSATAGRYLVHYTHTQSPPMGDRLVVAVGLMGSEDPADSACYESKGEETTKSPPVWSSEPGCEGAKISGDPVQSVCSQGVLTVPLLASILRS